ncbi:MAG TPA: hypothetical protein VM070_07215, partial [Candidatus Saccharimonadales bacterium]|nr:hypothetical protein [Candidatus Saccharimonadales bacterium]
AAAPVEEPAPEPPAVPVEAAAPTKAAAPVEAAAPVAAPAPADEAGAVPLATAPVDPVSPVDPDETVLDREARDARERLHDPARARQAAAEGWKTPTDEAGTTDRWG